MSSYKEDFAIIEPCWGWVRVAGGGRYAVKGKGVVKLDLVLPRGTINQSKLDCALYVPDMKNTWLFSWIQTRRKGY